MLLLFALGCGHDEGKESGIPDRDTASDADTDGDSDTDADTDTLPDDADHDGYPDAAAGGDDCDDSNDQIHPGATERCDTIDQDCDGDPLAGASCAEGIDADAGATWIADLDGEYAAEAVGDVTGDGIGDLLLTTALYDMAVLPGGPVPTTRPSIRADAWMTVDDAYGYGMNVGDVDGDGAEDIGELVRSFAGAVGVMLGPFTEGDALGPGDWDEDWPGYGSNSSFGLTYASGADFDGDGRDDFAVGAALAYTMFDPDTFGMSVYFGGRWGDWCPLGTSPGASPFALGDVDGDGVRDLGIEGGGAYVVSGVELTSSCGASLADASIATTDATDFYWGGWADVGDWTGDGTDDFVVGAPHFDTGAENAGEIYVFSGENVVRSGDVSPEAAEGSWHGAAEGDELGAWRLYAADFDGDGTSDLLAYASGWDQAVLRGGEVPSLHDPLPRYLAVADARSGQPADIDDDGYADLVVESWVDGGYRLGLVRGFEVPWDDSAYW